MADCLELAVHPKGDELIMSSRSIRDRRVWSFQQAQQLAVLTQFVAESLNELP